MSEAAIFVDGRYTVQVREQVDSRGDHAPPPHGRSAGEMAFEAVLRPTQSSASTPRLHTVAEVERLKGAGERAGAGLIALAKNPIDAIWTDRPSRPLSAPVVLHDEALGRQRARPPAGAHPGPARRAQGRCDSSPTMPTPWPGPSTSAAATCAHTPLPLSSVLIPRDGEPTLFVDGRKLSNAVRHRPSPGSFAALIEPGPDRRRWRRPSKTRPCGSTPTWWSSISARVIQTAGGVDPARPRPDRAAAARVKNEAEIARRPRRPYAATAPLSPASSPGSIAQTPRRRRSTEIVGRRGAGRLPGARRAC